MYKVTKEDLIGEIADFPIEVVQKMVDYQAKKDVSVFQNNHSGRYGGFSWSYTPEGWSFWGDVIIDKKFDVFFEKYPKESYKDSYKVTKEDLIGEIADFPIEVVQKMVDYQEEKDVSVFQKRVESNARLGGFSWSDTPEGLWFWRGVISNNNFDIFFEKYPKEYDHSDLSDITQDVIQNQCTLTAAYCDNNYIQELSERLDKVEKSLDSSSEHSDYIVDKLNDFVDEYNVLSEKVDGLINNGFLIKPTIATPSKQIPEGLGNPPKFIKISKLF